MDRNEKNERDKKMKYDKRTKEYKRSQGRPATGAPSVRSQANDLKGNIPEKSLVQASQSVENVDLDDERLSESKSETDAIPDTHKTFSKRRIVSNWSKYETALPSGDADYEVSKAADFASLLNTPMSEGGHFQFKSERIWEEQSPSQYSDVFSLDLKKLSTSLSCIPFYDQLSLSKELFSEDELKLMECEAEQNLEQYNDLLKKVDDIDRLAAVVKLVFIPDKQTSREPNPSTISQMLDNSRIKTSQASEQIVVQPTSLVEKLANPSVVSNLMESVQETPSLETDDELDFLLTLKEPISDADIPLQAKANPTSVMTKKDDLTDDFDAICLANPETNSEKKEDLEDWLDSMLDD